MGTIILSTRDNILCRHLLFDNKTAEISEGAIEPCDAEPLIERANAARGFSRRTR